MAVETLRLRTLRLCFLTSNKNPNSQFVRIVRFWYYPWRPHFRSSSSSSLLWDSRVQFNFRDEWAEDDEDSNMGFRWREEKRKRRWWDEDDSPDVDEEDGSGVLEEAIDSIWILKVFKNYGWMLPAIIISILLASGPKAFLMALALPLGQSIVFFVIDKVFGRTRARSKPRARTKKKPFAWAATNFVEKEEEQEENSKTTEGRQGYQSWVATGDGSVKKGDQRRPTYGGWDELDGQQVSDKGPMRRPPRTTGAPPRQGLERAKFTRRGRHRDTPLLLRLLIAVFPFLGSWTKLL